MKRDEREKRDGRRERETHTTDRSTELKCCGPFVPRCK